jgi:hypothetical protein
MPVDPYVVYAYWSVGPSAAPPQAQATLRFHDGDTTFDVDIDLQAHSWYIHLWSPEKTYVADLGFRRDDGEFIALARSNVVETPPAWPRLKVSEAATLVGPDAAVERAVTARERFAPGRRVPAVVSAPERPPDPDLTDLSESNYAPGVSSLLVRPKPT